SILADCSLQRAFVAGDLKPQAPVHEGVSNMRKENTTMRSHVLVGCIVSSALLPAAVLAQTSTPSFGKDIAPILYEKCATCHRSGEVAPMSLMTYSEVRPWARAIKAKVVAHQMPPWYADGEPGKWQNDRRLTQAQIVLPFARFS